MKRIEVESKGEKERHTHLNVEFHITARRDKKSFLSDQCKEIEENNRMGKTRDLSKKIRDTKGMFHAKMGTTKDRNGMDQEKQKILGRGGKNIQQNYTKKIFTTQIIMTTLLECKVKWTLGSITMTKASGGDGISVAAAAAKSLQSCPTLCNPMDGSPPGSPSLGFSRQEHWNGLPFPSLMRESEK